MKTLILTPYNYPDARRDVILFNYHQSVYSMFFAFEGIYARMSRSNQKLENETALMLYLAVEMTQKEYDQSDVIVGPAHKKFKFDRVIVYDFNLVSSQEAALQNAYPDFTSEFYTTADMTDRCSNIMEAIKLVESKPTEGDK